MTSRRVDAEIVAAAIATALVALVGLVIFAATTVHPLSDIGPDTTGPATVHLAPPTHPSSSTTSVDPVVARVEQTSITTSPPATIGVGEVFYPDCLAAYAAGRSSINRGEPGYRAGLDRDGDGIACEAPTPPPPPPPTPVFRMTLPSPLAPAPTTSTAGSSLTPPTSPWPPITDPDTIGPSSTPTTEPPTTTTGPPDTDPPPTTTSEPATTTTEPPPTTTTSPPPLLATCADAVQAAADGRITLPLTPDQTPWWNPALDVDGDGKACDDDQTPIPTTTTTTTSSLEAASTTDPATTTSGTTSTTGSTTTTAAPPEENGR